MKKIIILIFIVVFSSKNYSQNHKDQFKKIDSFMANNEYFKSLDLINQLILKDSLNYEYHLKKGLINDLLENYSESLNSYEKALRLNPKEAEVYEKISFFYYRLKKFDKVINYCDLGLSLENITLDNKNFLLFIKAESLFMLNKHKEAIPIYKYILNNKAIESFDTLTYISIAKAYVTLNQNDEAIFYLEKCLEKYPNFILAINNLAFRHNIKENYTTSLALFEKALKLSLKLKENEDRSVNFSEKLIGVEGSDKIAIALLLNNMSFAKHKLNRNDEALTDVNHSIALFPENSYAYRNLALIYIGLQEIDKACIAIDKSIIMGFTEQYGDEMMVLREKYCK